MTFGSDEIDKPLDRAIRNFSQHLQMVGDGQFYTDVTRSPEKLIHEINDLALLERKASGTNTIKLKIVAATISRLLPPSGGALGCLTNLRSPPWTVLAGTTSNGWCRAASA